MFSKRYLLFIAVALVGLFLIGCTTKSDSESGDVAAAVNGVGISIETFQNSVDRLVLNYEKKGFDFESEEGKAALEQINQQTINSLVQEEVLLQSAEQKGYEASEEMVEEQFEQIKGQFETEEEFQTALKTIKFSEDELKIELSNGIKIEQFLDGEMEEILVSEDEVNELYEKYKTSLESQSAETGKAQEVPAFEELKGQLEAEIKQGKEQEQIGQIIENLMENSKIEIFI